MGVENSGVASNPKVQEVIEIYGECTTYISLNDINSLREQLSPEDFAEVSARLQFDNPQVAEQEDY